MKVLNGVVYSLQCFSKLCLNNNTSVIFCIDSVNNHNQLLGQKTILNSVKKK